MSNRPKTLLDNVVLIYLAPRYAYRSTIISPTEIFCSPDAENQSLDNQIRQLKITGGSYDVRYILEKIAPISPSLLVIKADASQRNHLTNLSILTCPKVLICGDTHHLNKPIQTMIDYVKREKFDVIVSEHDRHHLHFFKEHGFNNLVWIPGFNTTPHSQPTHESHQHLLSFIGNHGHFHPYRTYILNKIKAWGLPLYQETMPRPKAAEVYSKSLINLNISLNGDLNFRVFEIISSGGFLLTDKLSPQSGLDLLFNDGEHLVTFSDEQDLRAKIEYYLNHPEEAKAIARRGCETYWKHYSPEQNVQRLIDYINGREIDPMYHVELDRRSVYF